MNKILLIFLLQFSTAVFSGPNLVSGKITSLMGSATNPAIRLAGNISPDLCDGGAWGWLYFQGTAQDRQWLYSTALAMAVSGKAVTVYTNNDGGTCRISNIQVTSGFN